MHPFTSAKFLVGAALALVAVGAATVAEARPEVYLSIGVPGGPAWVDQGPVYMQPRPVYVQPREVYVQPHPVYVRPQPVYVQPQPVYVQPQPRYVQPPLFASRPSVVVVSREVFERPRWGRDDERDAWERHRAWRRAEWIHHERYERSGRRDRDDDDNGHHHRSHRD